MKTPKTAMKKIWILLAALLTARVAAEAATLSPAVSQRIRSRDRSTLNVIVIFRSTAVPRTGAARNAQRTPAARLQTSSAASRPALSAFLNRYVPAAASGAVRANDLWLINGYSLGASAETLRRLAEDPAVESVFEDFEVRTPEMIPLARALSEDDDADWGLDKIGAPALWQLFGARGRGVRIGHLDTGVDDTHPDLAGKIAGWAEFDRWGDVVPGSVPHDDAGHGTHTAGTLVGGAAGGGPIGVAPEASLLCAKVLSPQGGSLTQVVAGLQWVLDPDDDPSTDDGARIVNMSLGAAGQYAVFDLLTARLRDAGVLPVFAIGNAGVNHTAAPGNAAGAVSVGATTEDDEVAEFSGGGYVYHGAQEDLKPEIAAPGAGILSCLPGGRYGAYSGTSMAAPHVAGAAALLLQLAPGMGVDELERLLTDTAADVDAPGREARSGQGRLDVLSAASRLMNVSVLRGVTASVRGPISAMVRVKDAAGSTLYQMRADGKTGQFHAVVRGGNYRVEAALSEAQSASRDVDMVDGRVVDVSLLLTVAQNLEDVLVYPNPFKPSRGDAAVIFSGLPTDATVRVYSFSGELVKELSGGAVGEAEWDARNDGAEPVASGLYFYVASAPGVGGAAKGRLAVIR